MVIRCLLVGPPLCHFASVKRGGARQITSRPVSGRATSPESPWAPDVYGRPRFVYPSGAAISKTLAELTSSCRSVAMMLSPLLPEGSYARPASIPVNRFHPIQQTSFQLINSPVGGDGEWPICGHHQRDRMAQLGGHLSRGCSCSRWDHDRNSNDSIERCVDCGAFSEHSDTLIND